MEMVTKFRFCHLYSYKFCCIFLLNHSFSKALIFYCLSFLIPPNMLTFLVLILALAAHCLFAALRRYYEAEHESQTLRNKYVLALETISNNENRLVLAEEHAKKLSEQAEKEIKDAELDAAIPTIKDAPLDALVASIEDLEKNCYSLMQRKSQLLDERNYLLIELESADERFERLAERNKFLEKAVMEELVMQENRSQAIEKELQNRTQALEKAVMEMEELVMQINLNAHSQLEAALTEIDELKSENRFHRLDIKVKKVVEIIADQDHNIGPSIHKASEVIGEMRDPCLVKDEILVTDGLSDLKELQKAVMEMEELVMQENVNALSQLEAALIEIDELKSENRFHRLHIKPSEISEADNPLLTKDNMLDQISECSSYGVSRREVVKVDNKFVEIADQISVDDDMEILTEDREWALKFVEIADQISDIDFNSVPSTSKRKTNFPSSGSLTEKEFGVEIADQDHNIGPSIHKVVAPTPEIIDNFPSSGSLTEKEFGVDSREGYYRKILRSLNSDLQELTNLHITIQDLRRKHEMTEKGKKGKTIDESVTLKEQLEEAEATILKLYDQNGKLLKYIDDGYLSSDSESEDSEKTKRKRISYQARRISEKIGRLQLEVQKIQFILLKFDDEKQRRSESKRRVTLRDYLYGVSETSQSRRKKVRFCACIRLTA